MRQTEAASKVGISLDLIETTWADRLVAQRRSSSQLSVEFSQAIDREKVDLRFGRARLNGPNKITINDAQGQSQQVTAGHVILATGSRPGLSRQPAVRMPNTE